MFKSFLESIQIGVDVMKLNDGRHTTEEKRREFFRLMRRQFTDDEWKQIDSNLPTVDAKRELEDGRHFTEDECKQIDSNHPIPMIDDEMDRRMASFYRHWSLKESYVKAVGTGLNLDLQRLNFQVGLKLNLYTRVGRRDP